MKKRILICGLLILSAVSFSFANDRIGIDKNVMNSFQRDFNNARDVEWESGKAFVKFTFKMNDRVLFAYYTLNGDLMAISRNISADQLPIYQLKTVKKNFGDYWISDLFEININSDTYYYITLESADYKVVLKSTGSDGWEVYRRERKS